MNEKNGKLRIENGKLRIRAMRDYFMRRGAPYRNSPFSIFHSQFKS